MKDPRFPLQLPVFSTSPRDDEDLDDKRAPGSDRTRITTRKNIASQSGVPVVLLPLPVLDSPDSGTLVTPRFTHNTRTPVGVCYRTDC